MQKIADIQRPQFALQGFHSVARKLLLIAPTHGEWPGWVSLNGLLAGYQGQSIGWLHTIFETMCRPGGWNDVSVCADLSRNATGCEFTSYTCTRNTDLTSASSAQRASVSLPASTNTCG